MNLVTDEKKRGQRFNWALFLITVLLFVTGLVNLYSAAGSWGEAGRYSVFWTQVLWIGIGLVVMFLLAFFDYRLFEKIASPLYIIGIILLLLAFLFGKSVAGHKSWLAVGGIALQPTEFAKIALVLMLSKYFSDHPHPEGVSILELWQPILYSALPTLLVTAQGDMGSAVFFILIFATYAWFGRLHGRGIAVLFLIAFFGAALLYVFGLEGYQKARITSFLNPAAEPSGSGYHLIQSRIAVGSGRITGRGYMRGNINKLRYLPEKHTDFVFPVLAEEWGFVGALFVVILYFSFFTTGIEVAKKARDRMGIFLALGIVSFMFWHVVVNLGGVLGLMPITGVPLPFLSYGGSFTMVSMASVGILMSVSMRRFLF